MDTPRILIVEDEQPLARVVSFALQNEGYRVESAFDGIDCMNKVSTFNPDLIVMDIMMPKLDGIETIRLLRQNQLHRDISIVVLSAKTSTESRKNAMDAGADAFVKKPFQITALVERVEELITSRRQM